MLQDGSVERGGYGGQTTTQDQSYRHGRVRLHGRRRIRARAAATGQHIVARRRRDGDGSCGDDFGVSQIV